MRGMRALRASFVVEAAYIAFLCFDLSSLGVPFTACFVAWAALIAWGAFRLGSRSAVAVSLWSASFAFVLGVVSPSFTVYWGACGMGWMQAMTKILPVFGLSLVRFLAVGVFSLARRWRRSLAPT